MPSLTVDPRAGSRDLIPHLRRLGVKVEEERMTYGDIAFVGNGPDGPIPVGIEHKSVSDVLQCIGSGRFAGHQLPGLLDSYADVWLLVEGAFHCGPSGELLVANRGRFGPVPWGQKEWMYRHLVHWLLSLQIQGAIRVACCDSKQQSAAFIKALHSWWTAKAWDEHASLKVMNLSAAHAHSYKRPSYLRKFAHTLPGIGWERSGEVERRFGNIETAVLAGAEEWAAVPGIGPVTARKVRYAITKKGA